MGKLNTLKSITLRITISGFKHLLVLFSFLLMLSCSSKKEEVNDEPSGPRLFTLLSPDETGVKFMNTLNESPNANVMMYEYFYNGGGVAAGDLNNDGLDDLYFSSNMESNVLYLNRGAMKFEDITRQSGTAGRNGPWKTGVSMADVNGDGWLDIYIAFSGNLRPERLVPQMLINLGPDANGIPRFEDKAAAYGLAIPNNTTQAYFFDYDRDSDLDLFLLNHNPQTLPPVDEVTIKQMLETKNPSAGLRLFRNDINNGNPSFSDVTATAGIHNSVLNYGLGAGIADINHDGYPDIYVGNDYIAPDYLYINNGNGTFTDQAGKSLGHTSHFSMGNDIADINNDGMNDIFSLDMLPEDNRRQKLLFAPDNYERFNLNVKTGLHHQYMRNMLHLNNGNGRFSEIGQLSGISNTDWSWSALFADYDNDGWKDLLVTNGYLRDFTNQDFVKYMKSYLQTKRRNIGDEDILKLIHEMPASDVVNYVFRNEGNLSFTDKGKDWGFNEPSNSNGAAYADLDNDGDLDLVINNINKPAFIYRNESGKVSGKESGNNFIRIKLRGERYNTHGIGARITLYQGGHLQYLEQMPYRGYQSSVSPTLHFGLGKETAIDSIRVEWVSGKRQVIPRVQVNQSIEIKESEALPATLNSQPVKPAFKSSDSYFREVAPPIKYAHATTSINDFKRQPLLVNPLSFSGPCLVKADINNDGLEDIFAGGGNGKPGMVFLQNRNGSFNAVNNPDLEMDRDSEDADAIFLDANGDKHLDLYIASGGYHAFDPKDKRLQDRLYFGNGKGNFKKASDALPELISSKGCAAAADYNGDGHTDIFVGGRVVPGRYPEAPESYLLLNDGKGKFTNVTKQWNAQLPAIGMVTDAVWMDVNSDQRPDLLLAGEWMPLTVMVNTGKSLEDKTLDYFGKKYSGWWNTLHVVDIDGDGREDIVAGNNGLNSQCRATEKEPAGMYYKDFDGNGAIDPILTFFIQGKSYPYVSRDELLDQVSMMRTRFADYKSYADATIDDIFTKEEMKDAGYLEANTLATMLFLRKENSFREVALPREVQFAPVFAITTVDYDRNGSKDIMFGGNIYNSRLRFGRSDANQGILVKNEKNGKLSAVPQAACGLDLRGDIRSVVSIGEQLIFGINQQPLVAYKLNKK